MHAQRRRDGRTTLASPRLLATLAAVAAVSLSASAQERRVFLLKSVPRLLRHGIAVGIVFGPGESFRLAAPQQASAREREAPDDSRSDRGELVAAFSEQWGSVFAIEDRDDVVSLTSRHGTACSAALSRPVKGRTFEGTVNQVFFDIGATFDDSLKDLGPRGYAVSSAAASSEEAAASADEIKDAILQKVHFQSQDGPLRQTLNAFARAAPGSGWYAEEACTPSDVPNPTCRCRVGFMSGSVMGSADWDACAGLSSCRAQESRSPHPLTE